MTTTQGEWARKSVFLAGALFCLTPWGDPALALAAGLVLALSLGNPFNWKALSKPLLQASVVLLGFGMNLKEVLHAGQAGLLLAFGTIAGTFVLGALIARWLAIETRISTLISAGTAICGGSAIAAVGSVIGAAEGEMTVAIGTVFLLNAIALYVFPPLGHLLHLSQAQFGMWSGVAIHDISSVVGASEQYGDRALQIATAVKLGRTLWIIPVAFIFALLLRRKHGETDGAGENSAAKPKFQVPWFIGLFLLAAVLRSYVPVVGEAAPLIKLLARAGFTLTLFIIGAGVSRKMIKAIGWRPLVQGILLWLFIATTLLIAVRING